MSAPRPARRSTSRSSAENVGAALAQRSFYSYHPSDRGTEAPPTFSRGHSSTTNDAIVKHTIMKINPAVNEPVRSLRLPIIFGPTKPPMLAVQLMKPIAAAAAELVRNAEGKAQNEGRYATVPNPTSVNTTMSST